MIVRIPYLSALDPRSLPEVSEQMNQLDFSPIACNNWPERFPYTPKVVFSIAHNGDTLFIKYKVEEASTLALIQEDNGEAWTDSCVEFFLALDDRGYYNFEFTCIGKLLAGFRKERPNPAHASSAILSSILRYPTLGNMNFEERQLGHPWELTIAIPATALFMHHLKSWCGLEARINLYKCGDKLSQRHYLSWQPIDTPKPDFHTPHCFIPAKFQNKV